MIHTRSASHFSPLGFLRIVVAGVLITAAGWGWAGAARAADLNSATPARQSAGRPAERIEGIWIWEPIYISDALEQEKMLAFCGRHGFNRLLVQIPWKHGVEATSPVILYQTELAHLIAEASKRHMVVEALDGETHMGDKANWSRSLATVDAVLAFNKSIAPAAGFVGIHWDIEPYTRPEWKDMPTRVQIETDYLGLLQQTHQKLQDSGSKLTLCCDIPMWYDDMVAPDDNCVVAFNGQTKNLHQHIQDVTDYVGIMSYRQKALGENSASAMIKNELAYAEKIGKFVCPAFETIQLTDTPQITFFGKSAEQFQTQRHLLEGALQDRPGFGGMLIHFYPGVCAVLEPNGPAK